MTPAPGSLTFGDKISSQIYQGSQNGPQGAPKGESVFKKGPLGSPRGALGGQPVAFLKLFDEQFEN